MALVSPDDYSDISVTLTVLGERRLQDSFSRQLTDIQHQRNAMLDFHGALFKGATWSIWFPAGSDAAYRIEFLATSLERMTLN